MQMFASVLKAKYAEKDASDGRTTYHIAIMPARPRKWRPPETNSSTTAPRM